MGIVFTNETHITLNLNTKRINCCGGWNRTTDLLVMSQASYQLLHPAIFRAFIATSSSYAYNVWLRPWAFRRPPSSRHEDFIGTF